MCKQKKDSINIINDFKLNFMQKIDSYYIDESNVLHTFVGDLKHITFENITSNEQAESIISDLNGENDECYYNFLNQTN